ncbi:hypothetical protein J5N97_008751 [Dioscorea zingiberensis]|uniref:Uncharacterized protein n=1 Tax=Dioscorea zingiberensis TaxID=325984 RepID=A0A9D5CVI8_9LILI|nr:hypothetical protein J5N97_008751 [Dioscorea zingiberensis]
MDEFKLTEADHFSCVLDALNNDQTSDDKANNLNSSNFSDQERKLKHEFRDIVLSTHLLTCLHYKNLVIRVSVCSNPIEHPESPLAASVRLNTSK